MISAIKNKIKRYVQKEVKKQTSLLYEENNKLKLDMENYGRRSEKQNNFAINQIKISLMTKDNIWFYSLPKSGTTYTINFLINYINIRYNQGGTPVDAEKLMAFHSMHIRHKKMSYAKIVDLQSSILNNTDFELFVHTHHKIESLSKYNIFISRNPLDFISSKYHWSYVNRGRVESISDVWKNIADKYIEVTLDQESMLDEDYCLSLKYEDIVGNPNEFKKVISFLGLDYDEFSYEKALEFSSVDSFKSLEKSYGDNALIAGKSFKEKSFIRSGKVGSWKQDINDDLKREIVKYLKDNGIKSINL